MGQTQGTGFKHKVPLFSRVSLKPGSSACQPAPESRQELWQRQARRTCKGKGISAPTHRGTLQTLLRFKTHSRYRTSNPGRMKHLLKIAPESADCDCLTAPFISWSLQLCKPSKNKAEFKFGGFKSICFYSNWPAKFSELRNTRSFSWLHRSSPWEKTTWKHHPWHQTPKETSACLPGW